MKRYDLHIDGVAVAPSSDEWFDTVEPFSGEAWAQIARGTAADADRAVHAAHAAFEAPAWRSLNATQRGALLRRIGALVEANVDRLAAVEQRDNGKLMAEVSGQMRNIAQYFYYYAGLADKIEGSVIPINKTDVFNYVKWEPLGVVIAITPWNSPLALATWKIAPALAAGNTMVIKPSEFTSASIFELVALIEEAGVPPGVVNVVTGYGNEVGTPLVAHPLTRKIAFTGGDAGGRAVAEAAAPGFKKVTLELGGKSPNIILDDADLPQAVKGAIAGVFAASGQTCMAGSRVLVHRAVHNRFVELLVEAVEAARIGDPSSVETEIGPICTAPQHRRILAMIDQARREGATLATGGVALQGEGFGQGQFIAPTVLTGVNNQMTIARDEVFGPVACVIPFDDIDEAIAIANDTEFGLAAAVWTRDLYRAFHCVDRLNAGTVWVNNYRATSFMTPFGGYKRSGLGREGGVEAIKEYLQQKSVWISTQPNRQNPFTIG